MSTPVQALVAIAVLGLGYGSPAPPKPPPVIATRGPSGEIVWATRPQRISGQAPTYSQQACEAKVEGTAVVKCLITTEGTAHGAATSQCPA
jgi:outer membrane biosynthesis protein TonB